MRFLKVRYGRAALFAAVAAGLALAPLSAGGGYAGVNGKIVAVNATGDIVEITTGGTTTTLVSGAGATVGDGVSLAPDASKVAYTVGASVHVHCLTTSCDTNVATGTDPAFSPDGNTIAYVDATGHIETVPTAGGSSTDLTPSATDDEEPSWSPDGTKIVFANEQSAHYEIWTVNVSSHAQTQVTSNTVSSDRQPAWSPNGNTIAFQSTRSGVNQVYTVTTSGGSLTQLTTGTLGEDPVWSPDSTTIAYTDGTSVLTIPSSGGSATTVTALAGAETGDWETLVPTNSVRPTVSTQSNPAQGNTVTASRGTWSGASSYLYQFERCNTDGSSCSTIGSASSSASYTLTSSDVGSTIRVLVQGVDTAGTAAAVESSNFTAVIIGPGPTNVSLPTIVLGTTLSGDQLTQPHVGSYLTSTIGSWTGSGNTYAYQWKKCDPKTGSCFTIPDADDAFYLPTNDVYGYDLRLQVTATNGSGSNSVNSDPTDTVTADAPVNTVSPQITGKNTQGQTLAVSAGTWTGSAPLVFTYQWRRCDPQGSLASCVAIAGATTPSYTLAAADVGVAIRAYVTATNVTGSVTVFTNHTFPTIPAPATGGGGTGNKQSTKPANAGRPAITGTATVGTALVASKGTWNGQAPIAYRYAWQRCDALGSGCRPIPKANKPTFKLTATDLGDTIRVAVTASNKLGKATSLSVVTGAVSLGKPLPRGRHIVGSNKADYLAGGGGNDTILGRGGNDTILGGAGDDLLEGGPGNDVIDGGPGRDRILGGPGSDTIQDVDGEKDVIDCGPGRDHAIVDKIDVVKNCELITYGTPPTTGASGGTGAGGSQ